MSAEERAVRVSNVPVNYGIRQVRGAVANTGLYPPVEVSLRWDPTTNTQYAILTFRTREDAAQMRREEEMRGLFA